MQIKEEYKIKKILLVIYIIIFIFVSITNIISCTKKSNWNDIPVNEPLLPIKVNGFNDIYFKTINPQNNKQTIPQLLKQLKEIFKNSKWIFDKLVKKYKFNNQIKLIDKIDLYRNGKYELNFNDGTILNEIKINKIVTNSNFLADKIKSIDLGKITDLRPKTILISVIFNNIKLISELDKFGEFFIGEQKSIIWNKQINKVDKIIVDPDEKSAILETNKNNWSENDNQEKEYYGFVKVYFFVVKNNLSKEKNDLSKMKLIKDLGKLPKITILQVMMMFISINFVSQLERLSFLLNDLYLYINSDKKSAKIIVYNESDYYTGSIDITFS